MVTATRTSTRTRATAKITITTTTKQFGRRQRRWRLKRQQKRDCIEDEVLWRRRRRQRRQARRRRIWILPFSIFERYFAKFLKKIWIPRSKDIMRRRIWLERIDFLRNVSAESLSLHPTLGMWVVSYLLLHLLLFLFDIHYQCHFAVKPQLVSTG